MFGNQSRYRSVPDVALARPDGRVVLAKALRPLPEVTGTFTHTLAAGDRLDQLAFTYYGRPLDYWRICDANPDLLSPLALVGQEPLLTTRFPVVVPEGAPAWAALLAALSGTGGVEDVTIVDDVALEPATMTVSVERPGESGEPGRPEEVSVPVVAERHSWAVLVTHNQVTIEADAIARVIASTGFTVVEQKHSTAGRLGRPIVIPIAAQAGGAP